MRRLLAATALAFLVLLAGGCSSSGSDPATTQEKFGVRMAKMNLWREAMFRFARAVEMNPEDAMARNNLAVAYEANGDFENAAKAYREAMRLDRSNEYIQKNYSRFVEFTTRDRRRQQQQRRAAGLIEEEAKASAADAAPPTPPTPSAEPESPTPVEASTPEDGSPAPTAAAPAATPAPNPAPPQTAPDPVPPPGGLP